MSSRGVMSVTTSSAVANLQASGKTPPRPLWSVAWLCVILVARDKSHLRGKALMVSVYVEARPKGRPEGSHTDDYVVEDHADHVLGTFKTQHEAIEWAKKNGHTPHVARVRHLNDKKTPGHWRAA
jgi:hypothetical protein